MAGRRAKPRAERTPAVRSKELRVLVAADRLSAADRALVAARPQTRGDCEDGPRPCPWVACRHHHYQEVTPAGGIKTRFGATPLEDIPSTCSLDDAARGGMTLDEVANTMNLTRERVRQIEDRAVRKIKAGGDMADWREGKDDGS